MSRTAMAFTAFSTNHIRFPATATPTRPTPRRPARPLALPLQSNSSILGGGSIAALILADPEKHRQTQAEEVGGSDKEVVREYFNNSGFQRWRRIYGDADNFNRVQHDIRLGHSKTVDNAMKMLLDDGPLAGVTVCDIGSLAIPLAKEGAVVFASDISAAMVTEAERQTEAEAAADNSQV